MRRVILTLLLAGLLAAALASAGSSARSGARAPSPGSSVTISNEQGTTWTCNFNPYNASVQFLSFGPVYEPLVFQDVLKSGAPTPWLASKYAWSNDNKTLMFTIRPGVKWSDGKPLTAADVVFTFQLIKKHPALDLNAVWSVLSHRDPEGLEPGRLQLQDGGRTVLLLRRRADADRAAAPLGTGEGPGHVQGSQSSRQRRLRDVLLLTAGDQVHEERDVLAEGAAQDRHGLLPGLTSNDPANLDLATGKAQWGSQFIPSIKSFYLSKSPDNHYWFPPVVNVSIFMNLKDPILSNLAVRKAMAYAIDRARVSQIGEYGYQPPANQTAIVTPTFKSWLKPGLDKVYRYDPQKAISILKAAGFTQKGGVFQTPAGKPLSFTMVNIGGYSDWVASAQIVAQD